MTQKKQVLQGLQVLFLLFNCQTPETPEKMTSWEFFDYLLKEANVVGTPGSGFGAHGEGYFRLTAFGTYENTRKAIDRIKNL